MNLREWALPVYTVLIQMAVGMLLFLWGLRLLGRDKFGQELIDRVIRNPLLIILITSVLGMMGGHFHLSRPYYSFLAVSNFRTSWLSREIVFTVLFFLSTTATWFFQWYRKENWRLVSASGWLAIFFGLITVFCMAHIYLLPTQAAWNSPETIPSFFSSMLLLGVMAVSEILIMDLRVSQVRQDKALEEWAILVKKAVKGLAKAAAAVLIMVIIVNLFHLYWLQKGTSLAQTSYDLLVGLYKPLLVARFIMLVAGVGTLIIPVALMVRNEKPVQELYAPAFLACLLVIIGEVLGRFLFYAVHIRTGL